MPAANSASGAESPRLLGWLSGAHFLQLCPCPKLETKYNVYYQPDHMLLGIPLSSMQHTRTRAAGCEQAPLKLCAVPSGMKFKCALQLGQGRVVCIPACSMPIQRGLGLACGMQHDVC